MTTGQQRMPMKKSKFLKNKFNNSKKYPTKGVRGFKNKTKLVLKVVISSR